MLEKLQVRTELCRTLVATAHLAFHVRTEDLDLTLRANLVMETRASSQAICAGRVFASVSAKIRRRRATVPRLIVWKVWTELGPRGPLRPENCLLVHRLQESGVLILHQDECSALVCYKRGNTVLCGGRHSRSRINEALHVLASQETGPAASDGIRDAATKPGPLRAFA